MYLWHRREAGGSQSPLEAPHCEAERIAAAAAAHLPTGLEKFAERVDELTGSPASLPPAPRSRRPRSSGCAPPAPAHRTPPARPPAPGPARHVLPAVRIHLLVGAPGKEAPRDALAGGVRRSGTASSGAVRSGLCHARREGQGCRDMPTGVGGIALSLTTPKLKLCLRRPRARGRNVACRRACRALGKPRGRREHRSPGLPGHTWLERAPGARAPRLAGTASAAGRGQR